MGTIDDQVESEELMKLDIWNRAIEASAKVAYDLCESAIPIHLWSEQIRKLKK